MPLLRLTGPGLARRPRGEGGFSPRPSEARSSQGEKALGPWPLLHPSLFLAYVKNAVPGRLAKKKEPLDVSIQSGLNYNHSLFLSIFPLPIVVVKSGSDL